MKFTVVEELPRKREYNPLGNYLKEFMRMNVKIARVDLNEHEYSTPSIAARTMATAIKRRALPIKVRERDGEVYLVRTDM